MKYSQHVPPPPCLEHHCADLLHSDLFPRSVTPFCIKEHQDKGSDLERQMGFYPEASDTD